MGILEDVPIKVGDFYVPIDLVVVDMAEDSRTKIILGRPFLATVGCKVDVKEEKLAFDMGKHHVEFGLFKDFESYPFTLPCCGCEVLYSIVPVNILEMSLNDHSSFDCTLFKGSGLDGAKVDSFPPSTIEDKPYVVNEDYLSACCRFITLWMSMPLMIRGVYEMDVGVEFGSGPFKSDGPRMTVLLDPSLWRDSYIQQGPRSRDFEVVPSPSPI